jgi:hypothetical protein
MEMEVRKDGLFISEFSALVVEGESVRMDIFYIIWRDGEKAEKISEILLHNYNINPYK